MDERELHRHARHQTAAGISAEGTRRYRTSEGATPAEREIIFNPFRVVDVGVTGWQCGAAFMRLVSELALSKKKKNIKMRQTSFS